MGEAVGHAPSHFRSKQVSNGWMSWAIMGLGAAFVVAVAFYQLVGLHQINRIVEYDDGCYFGASLRMADGILPYRSFVLAQPPLVPLLMLPFALIAKSTSTAAGMEAARCSVTFVQAACVVLAGLMVRHRGRVAVLVAVTVSSVYPIADIWQRTVMLEPFCLFFCMLGAKVLFEGDRLTESRKRLWWSGIFFGLAGCSKAFALLAFVPLLMVLVVYRHKVADVARFVGGAAIAVIVVIGPFFAASPVRFFQQAILMQIVRTQPSMPNKVLRAQAILDLWPVWIHHGIFASERRAGLLLVVLVIVVVIALGLVIRGVKQHDWLSPIDIGLLAASVVSFLGLMSPSAYYQHYVTYFTAIFGTLLGLAAGSVARAFPARGAAYWLISAPLVLVLLAGAVGAAGHTVSEAYSFREKDHKSVPLISAWVKPGACVVTDDPALLILANRFYSSDQHCPKMVDSYGTTLSVTKGSPAASPKADHGQIVRVWLRMIKKAQYLVLSYGLRPKRIPWGAHQLRNYLLAHFTPRFMTHKTGLYGPTVWIRVQHPQLRISDV